MQDYYWFFLVLNSSMKTAMSKIPHQQFFPSAARRFFRHIFARRESLSGKCPWEELLRRDTFYFWWKRVFFTRSVTSRRRRNIRQRQQLLLSATFHARRAQTQTRNLPAYSVTTIHSPPPPLYLERVQKTDPDTREWLIAAVTSAIFRYFVNWASDFLFQAQWSIILIHSIFALFN
jgi:hypothetical protein